MKIILVLLPLLIVFSGCEKNKTNPDAGKVVEFYLIDDYMTDLYDMQINEDGATLKDPVLISYDQIISYNSKTYDFEVSEEVISKLSPYDAFAVTVDREIIYTGYFWTSISSRTVNWIVIDLLFREGNNLHVELGYPGLMEGMVITDRRNDTRILDVLRRDKKLIE